MTTNILTSSNTTHNVLPKRPIQKKQNRLGPYNLLQTLGEGEFGKVKLGIHTETGEEVTTKFARLFFFFFINHVLPSKRWLSNLSKKRELDQILGLTKWKEKYLF